MELARSRPEPIPAIHPLAEYLAEGQRKAWYEDMKQVFQVPWMGVVTMAFSHYPNFYDELWRGARELCASRPYVEACRDNRAFVETGIMQMNPRPIAGELAAVGYAPREIENIRQMIEVFSHGNQPYLILATIARYLLECGDMGGATDPAAAPAFEGRHAPAFSVPFVLMEAHHADQPTRDVFEDLKQALNLPFVNTDYRALARWPSYWALAWSDSRAAATRPAHEDLCEALHRNCVRQTREGLPNPGGLSADALRRAAERDAPLAEIVQMCRLFQWLLPGLVANVAYLRAQLDAG